MDTYDPIQDTFRQKVDVTEWWAHPSAIGPMVPVEPTLSIKERFRLVEIAHETKDRQIRNAAMELLYPSFVRAKT